jgi:hypothetical protein
MQQGILPTWNSVGIGNRDAARICLRGLSPGQVVCIGGGLAGGVGLGEQVAECVVVKLVVSPRGFTTEVFCPARSRSPTKRVQGTIGTAAIARGTYVYEKAAGPQTNLGHCHWRARREGDSCIANLDHLYVATVWNKVREVQAPCHCQTQDEAR